MDSTSVSLFELAESYNKAALGHSLKLGAVLALICGSLPFLTGLFGFVLPRAKALLVVSIASFAIIVVSGVVFYVWISSIDQLHVMKMGFGLGAYITCVILVLEISAGIISRYKAAP